MPNGTEDFKNGTSALVTAEFTFENHAVRTIAKDGEPWFVANDVCQPLDHSNPRKAIEPLDEDEKGVTLVYTPGGPQEMNIINEFGLYNLIFTSRKPEAKRFKRWVIHEVLPAIRKTGKYETPPQAQAELSDQPSHRTNHFDGEGNDRFDEVFARVNPTTPDQKFDWIKEMLTTPGRYRISVYLGGKTTAYRSNIGVMLDECNQVDIRVLGLTLQMIEARWERFRLEQSDFDQINRHDQIIKQLEREIQHGANVARLTLAHIDELGF